MAETRTERFSVSMTPTLLAKLDEFASQNHWSRARAIEVLVEEGLAEDDDDQEGEDH